MCAGTVEAKVLVLSVVPGGLDSLVVDCRPVHICAGIILGIIG